MIKLIRSLRKLTARPLPAVTHRPLLRPHLRAHMPPKALLTAAKFMFSVSKNSKLYGTLPIGIGDFNKLMLTPFFVDKTKFLVDLLMKKKNVRFSVFTRPRRSGKSIQLSMIR